MALDRAEIANWTDEYLREMASTGASGFRELRTWHSIQAELRARGLEPVELADNRTEAAAERTAANSSHVIGLLVSIVLLVAGTVLAKITYEWSVASRSPYNRVWVGGILPGLIGIARYGSRLIAFVAARRADVPSRPVPPPS